MSEVLSGTSLGILEIVEVYSYFDGPRLFLCRNRVDHLFLAYWLEDRPEGERWLFVSLSKERCLRLRSGAIDIRSAIINAEDGGVMDVTWFFDGRGPEEVFHAAAALESLGIPLPAEGDFVAMDSREHRTELESQVGSRQALVRHARQSFRESMAVKLKPRVTELAEISARPLGEFLSSLQGVVNALTGSRGDSGRYELLATAVFQSSFGMHFVSASSADLFGRSPLAEPLAALVSLLNIGADRAALIDALSSMRPRTASSYRNLLRSISAGDVDLELDWASPDESRGGSARIDKGTADLAASILAEIEEELPTIIEKQGTFIGLNLRLQSYELVDTEQRRYTGKIEIGAVEAASRANHADTYVVLLREVPEVAPATGRRTAKYDLLELRRLDRPADE